MLYRFSMSQKITKREGREYVKVIYSMPVSYDPAQMNDSASLTFSELVYDGLLKFGSSFNLEANLAKSWKTSTDGTTLTFTLNDKARFHNNEPVTAFDVVESLKRTVAPESKVYKYYEVIEGAELFHFKKSKTVSGLRVIDKKTVQVKLKFPFSPFLYVLAGGTAKILPAKFLEKNVFKNPIGSGPFKIKDIGKSEIKLVGNKRYHGKVPNLTSMVLKQVDQNQGSLLAIQGDVHDLSSWPMSGKEKVFNFGQDISAVIADTWIIGLNSRFSPFDQLDIRRSFKNSIDSENFRKTFYPDATSAYGYVPPGFPGYIDQVKPKNKSDITSDKQITLTIPKGLGRVEEIAEFFRNELNAKGWNIKTEIMEWSEMMEKYKNKELQAFLVSMIVDYPDSEFLLNNFSSSNPDNYSGLNEKEVDYLIDLARRQNDRLERNNTYKKLAKKINEKSLSVNLFHSRPHYWIHKCVRGFQPNMLATSYIDYKKVYFDEDCMHKENI